MAWFKSCSPTQLLSVIFYLGDARGTEYLLNYWLIINKPTNTDAFAFCYWLCACVCSVSVHLSTASLRFFFFYVTGLHINSVLFSNYSLSWHQIYHIVGLILAQRLATIFYLFSMDFSLVILILSGASYMDSNSLHSQIFVLV